MTLGPHFADQELQLNPESLKGLPGLTQQKSLG